MLGGCAAVLEFMFQMWTEPRCGVQGEESGWQGVWGCLRKGTYAKSGMERA